MNMVGDETMTKYSDDPWSDAVRYADKLVDAVTECGWRHGSCHSDFDEKGVKWLALIDQAERIVAELNGLVR